MSFAPLKELLEYKYPYSLMMFSLVAVIVDSEANQRKDEITYSISFSQPVGHESEGERDLSAGSLADFG